MPRSNHNNAVIPLQFRENSVAPPVSEQRLSVISILCRICYDSEKEEPLITPCRCKGTVAFVHRSCLEKWLAESNTTACELCHQVFKTERTPKYTSRQSIWKWLKLSRGNARTRGVRSDLLACGLLTPIAILITYVCLFSADYYNQKKFASIPAARWTSLSLLFMIAIMLIGYYLWVYSVIRIQARMWYNWWQRECTVKYVPPSTVNICSQCPSGISTPNNTPISITHLAIDATCPENRSCNYNRVDSIYQMEEEEIYHEALDIVSETKQKASAVISSDILLEGGEKFGEEQRRIKSESGPIKLVKNEGYIYIINISKPNDDEESNSKVSENSACFDLRSVYSEESENADVSSASLFTKNNGHKNSLQKQSNDNNITKMSTTKVDTINSVGESLFERSYNLEKVSSTYDNNKHGNLLKESSTIIRSKEKEEEMLKKTDNANADNGSHCSTDSEDTYF